MNKDLKYFLKSALLKVQQEITVLEVPLPGGGGVTCDTCFSRIYVYRTILGMRGTSVISRVFGEMVGALYYLYFYFMY